MGGGDGRGSARERPARRGHHQPIRPRSSAGPQGQRAAAGRALALRHQTRVHRLRTSLARSGLTQ